MKPERLADTEEIRKIESRFVNLIERTFLKGAVGKPAPQIVNSVKQAFSSKTYELQLDKIIDDIYIASVNFADKKAEELGLSSGSTQASRTAAKDKPLPITAEAIKQTKALSGDAAESVTRWLKDNDLYTQHPDQLARQVKDLWEGERYKARRFAVTFTADLSENTAIHRYSSLGINYLQFYAEIDDRTTPQCRQFHGTIIPSNSLDAQRYRPPLHHHCRSALIPATSKVLKENQDLLIENRDFTQHLGQDFEPLKMRSDIETVNQVLDDIHKFNDKYRIDQFILDEDIQLRLMKLKLNILPELPGKTTLDDFVKPDKGEPPKPKPLTGPEIRAKIPEAKEAYSQRVLEANRKQIAARRAKDEIYDEYDKAFAKGADQKTLDEIYKRMDTASQDWYKALTEYQDLRQDEQRTIRELLYINDGAPKSQFLKLDPATDINSSHFKRRTQETQNALDFLNNAVSKDIRDKLPDLQLYEIGNERAHTIRDTNTIWIGNSDLTETLLHEIGHNIEYNNPDVLKSAKAHIKSRTKGEKARTLNAITNSKSYRPDERAKEDKFITPYIGKITGGESTEATSTAIQYLYDNPEILAERDPELFDWIVNTLRGQYD